MTEVMGFEVRELFDPVQTHAVYGVPANCESQVRDELRAMGATRLRKVKTAYQSLIICFKMPQAQ